MIGSWRSVVLAFVLGGGPWIASASAQSLGTFSWQLAPYCNIVTVNVAQAGAIYTLSGYDDQCGAAERAAITGTAFVNPTGQVGLGLTIVTTSGGTSVHVDGVLDLATLGGSWTDDHGNSGAMVYGAAGPAAGAPRPLGAGGLANGSVTTSKLADGAVTAAKIDPAQVQRRIASACPAGQLMTAVHTDGTVACEAVTSTSGGDISGVGAGSGLLGGGDSGDVTLYADFTTLQRRVTGACPPGQMMTSIGSTGSVTCEAPPTATGDISAVIAGAGLTGGATSGNATLSVSFAGTGITQTVARADHVHGSDLGAGANTNIGSGALGTATPGGNNTAVGFSVLGANLAAGNGNTGVGAYALQGQQSGIQNTGVGSFALQANTAGSMNTAVGREALYQLVGQSLGVGSRNTALGKAALGDLTDGYTNTAIGAFAGDGLTSGRDNIYIGSAAGAATENFTTRIGTGFAGSRTFVTGIRGVTTGVNDAVAVVVDSAGQLGTVSSSRRTKFDIADLAAPVTEALHQLRPVQFRYRQAFNDGSTPIQYGLIAEEVGQILPELVAYGADGSPETVKYQALPSLLLADVQRLERERQRLETALANETSRVSELERRLEAQVRALDELRGLVVQPR
jgi:hypothetical protein